MFGVFRKVRARMQALGFTWGRPWLDLCGLEQFAAVLWGGEMPVPHKPQEHSQDAVMEPEALAVSSCTPQVWSETSQQVTAQQGTKCTPVPHFHINMEEVTLDKQGCVF